MTALEEMQAIHAMAEAMSNDRAEGAVTEDLLDDARAAWLGLRAFMEGKEMVFYIP